MIGSDLPIQIQKHCGSQVTSLQKPTTSKLKTVTEPHYKARLRTESLKHKTLPQ